MSLGKNIRLQRIKQNLTGQALAEMTDVSSSMISKIEHEAANPSYDLLVRIARALNTSVSSLVAPASDQPGSEAAPARQGRIALVHPEQRKILHLPSSGQSYEILTPDLQGALEFAWVEMAPGSGGSETFAHRTGEESLLVLEGVLHVYVAEEQYTLRAGDCLTFDAQLPHRYRNEGSEKCVWVATAAPPAL